MTPVFRRCVVAITLVTCVLAVPVPLLNVPSLVNQADVIAVGFVSSVSESGQTDMTVEGRVVPARIVVGQFQVIRTIKGVATPTVQFTFVVPDQYVGIEAVPLRVLRILFLRREGETLRPASQYYPSLPAVSKPLKPSGDPVLNVEAELASVVSSDDAPEQSRLEAIAALQTIQTRSATEILRKLSQTSDERLRLWSIVYLLNRNDVSAIERAGAYLERGPDALPPNMFHNLAQAIYLGVKDPRAVPYLAPLASSRFEQVRRAAIFALRNTGSSDASPSLLKALRDPDFETRYYAVIGLAEIANEPDWRPSEDAFRANEHRYVEHWAERPTGRRSQ
jgi:HEAT repeat protein